MGQAIKYFGNLSRVVGPHRGTTSSIAMLQFCITAATGM
jgi:hypothetical protein